MSNNKAKIALIADDHVLYRCGLSLFLTDRLGFGQVLEAGTLDEALDCLEKKPGIDLALIDLSMPGMRGGTCLAEIRAQFPNSKFAVVSASEDKADVLAAIDAGFNGFMSKSLSNVHIAGAIRDILDGGIYIPTNLMTNTKSRQYQAADQPSLQTERSPPVSANAAKTLLTARQNEVFDLACEGLSNKEIGDRLGISEGTVKVHISAMLTILRLRNRAEFLSLR